MSEKLVAGRIVGLAYIAGKGRSNSGDGSLNKVSEGLVRSLRFLILGTGNVVIGGRRSGLGFLMKVIGAIGIII